MLSQVSGGYQQVNCEAPVFHAPHYGSLSLGFLSSKQKAALQLDRPIWETADSWFAGGEEGRCIEKNKKGNNRGLGFF